MKKIFALVALLAITPLYAAHNEFTFDVNSSGPNIYVCGFAYDCSGPAGKAFKLAPESIDRKTMRSQAYATWTTEWVNEWEDKVFAYLDQSTSGKNRFIAIYDVSDSYDYELGEYQRVNDLVFNLGDEFYGCLYHVDVCYNVPLYLDVSKVDFDVDMNVQFTDLKNGAKGYTSKSKLEAILNAYPSEWGEDYSVDIAQGNAHYETTLNSVSRNNQLRMVYTFWEHSEDRRPHVAHGGHFTLDTTVTPVEKSTATK